MSKSTLIIVGFVFIAVALVAFFNNMSEWGTALILAAIGAGSLFIALRS